MLTGQRQPDLTVAAFAVRRPNLGAKLWTKLNRRCLFAFRARSCAPNAACRSNLSFEGSAVERNPQLLQAAFLENLRDQRTPVFIFLVNGIKLHGTIESFDNYVLAVHGDVTQIVFKHAISTVMPASAGVPGGLSGSGAGAGARARTPRGGSGALR